MPTIPPWWLCRVGSKQVHQAVRDCVSQTICEIFSVEHTMTVTATVTDICCVCKRECKRKFMHIHAMCVCVCVRMRTCLYTICKHARVDVKFCLYWVCSRVQSDSKHTHTFTWYTYAYLFKCVCVFIYSHTHTNTHARTHTHTHTHTLTHTQPVWMEECRRPSIHKMALFKSAMFVLGTRSSLQQRQVCFTVCVHVCMSHRVRVFLSAILVLSNERARERRWRSIPTNLWFM